MKKEEAQLGFLNALNIIIEDLELSKDIASKYLPSDLLSFNINSIKKRIKKQQLTKLNALIHLIKIRRSNNLNGTILFNNAVKIYDYYSYLKSYTREHFIVIYLNHNKEYIQDKCLFIGTINASLVHPRDIFKLAYLISASFIICIHNHPSGNTTPSPQDIELTNKLNELGKLHGILLLDHIIIGQKYYSFFDEHML